MNDFEYKIEAEKTIKRLKERVAELEEQVTHHIKLLEAYQSPKQSAEPVAWIIQDKYGRPALSWKGEPISYNAISVEQEDIPLYTTPQIKELSDVVEALKMMVEEFKQLDLPYGSKAYAKATEVLRGIKNG